MPSIRYQPWGAAKAIPSVLFSMLVTLLIIGSLTPSTLTVSAFPTSHGSRQTNNICTNPPRDSCAFYADCLESKYHCGPEGYPIGFGQSFCEKFSANRAELSTKGQTWMLDTMQCLQNELVPEATATTGVTCRSLEKKAFASHAKCYVESGLCTLPPSDWLAIVEIVEIKTLFESKNSFLATLNAGKGCIKTYLFFLKELIF
ncbi:hypothetical protein D9615_006576 [Tricholomella constricta]|uniref:Uncharacterized protein n=1 Tax=Tricholomella constricta TaxID=117010 RepID=A0A8H5M3L8_9AGAR|nr:hypothetical protein D9615_006576 [Tricholomella constricta]